LVRQLDILKKKKGKLKMTTEEFEKQLADAGITKEEAEYCQLLNKHWDKIEDFRKQFIADPKNYGEPPTTKQIKAEIQRLESKEKKQALYIPGKITTIETTQGHEKEMNAEFYRRLAKYKSAINYFAENYEVQYGEYPSVTDINAELQRLELDENTTNKVVEPVIQESVPVSEVRAPIIKTESESKTKTQGTKAQTPVLNRQAFTFSRELEFFSEKELTTQIGLPSEYWLAVILKELLDNALDGCETVGVSPDITVSIIADSICIQDNGAGIPPEVVTKILDFTSRTSDKAIYCSPSRGQQGNAIKCILAIPFVLSAGKKDSHVVIESHGISHDIRVSLDIIAGKPLIEHKQVEIVKIGGTKITVYTGIQLEAYKSEFLQIVLDFFRFSPHMSLTTHGLPSDLDHDASIPHWQKWTPHQPTSPYWYSLENFKKLISANIALSRDGGRDYTLREFISQFKGLSYTGRQRIITKELPATVKRLSNLVLNSRELDDKMISLLLSLMQQETKPVPPEMLGVIGEKHLQRFFQDPIKYHCIKHKGEVPFIVEAAFGYSEQLERPEFSFGLNFSPAFSDPFANVGLSDGKDKQGYGVYGLAGRFELNHDDKARLIVHVTHPCLTFNDKGKGHINPGEELRKAVGLAVAAVLKEHYALRKKADKQAASEQRHEQEEREAARPKQMSLKDAVFTVLPQAILQASDGNLEFQDRQLYYQVRPLIAQYTNKELTFSYFSPPLLTEYEEQHGEIPGLLFDGRGHFQEPHQAIEFELGTKEVNNYQIPDYEYDKILFIEKEGFKPILDAARLGQRYDMAIMTDKGFIVRAAKKLLARATSKQIIILAVHDADISGYDIARTLVEETRTTKGLVVKVIDIGLKVADALAMGLPPEPVNVKHEISSKLKPRLTTQELEFFKKFRVELNAMTSSQLIDWIESNIAKLGLAKKVIPPPEILSNEIFLKLKTGLKERADAVVKETLGKVLGDLDELAFDLLKQVKEPNTKGYIDELRDDMSGLPTQHWRSWATNKAENLVDETDEELRALAENKIKELLKRGNPNGTDITQ